jgi:PAS domain S-box-containing protein
MDLKHRIGSSLVLDLKLSHKGLLIAFLPLAFAVIFMVTISYLLWQAQNEAEKEFRARAIYQDASECVKSMFEIFGNFTLSSKLRDPEALPAFHQRMDECEQQIRQMRKRCLYNSVLVKLADKLLEYQAECKQFGEETMALKSIGGHRASPLRTLELKGKAVDILRGFRLCTAAMRKELEREQSKGPADVRVYRNLVTSALAGGVGLSVLISAALAIYIHRSIISRIEVVAENSKRLTDEQPLHELTTGADEIGLLDKAFHDMAISLKDARRKERAMVDNARDVICSLSPELEFVAVNQASKVIWGFEPETLKGRPLTQVVHPDDAPRVIEDFKNTMVREGDRTSEFRLVREEGGTIDTLWSLVWSAAENRIFCVAHDISERTHAERVIRASEARTRLMMERMPAALILMDKSGTILESNWRSVDLLKGESIAGRSFMDFIAGVEAEKADAFELLLRRSSGKLNDVAMRTATGEQIHVQLSLDELGEDEVKYLAVMQDVSERHQFDQLKRELIAMIAHDIRTPLMAIQGTLQLLEAGPLGSLNERGSQRVAQSEKETKRLIRLFNDLLKIEKYDARQLEIVPCSIEVREVIEEAVNSIIDRSSERSITIEISSMDGQIYADRDRIIQVLFNLLSNAIKYSPENSCILVSAVAVFQTDVEISVIDQGTGVPDWAMEKIFQAFKQAGHEDSTVKGGTGLGLAICRSIVEAHGGKIGVENRTEGGARFWFRIACAGQSLIGVQQDPLHA